MTSNKPYVVIRLAQRGGLCEPRLEPEESTPRNRYDVRFFSWIPAQSIGLDPLRLHDIAMIAAVERTEALDLGESLLRMRRNDMQPNRVWIISGKNDTEGEYEEKKET
jgi:hypothetical protein